jgi:pentatricopeptide repeat protein
MQQERMSPEKFISIQVINACVNLGAHVHGRLVHQQHIQNGCEYDVFVCNILFDMYTKCGSIEDAWTVFKKMAS